MNNQDTINFLKERKAYHEGEQARLIKELAIARKDKNQSRKGREYMVRDIDNEAALVAELGYIVAVVEAFAEAEK